MSDSVAILLGTHNGALYLGQQLDSIAAQTHGDWTLWASDDASSDCTQEILVNYSSVWPQGKMIVLPGPCKAVADNFLSLVCNPRISGQYFAYCDQDDVWEAGKLARALEWMAAQPQAQPALYCSRTRYVDEHDREIGLSPRFDRKPCFANAMVQNIAGGNTMVFNQAARTLLLEAGSSVPVVMHDWWTYLAVAGCGGQIHYDTWPSLHYRQHGANLIGKNTGLQARMARIRLLWDGRFRAWAACNIAALKFLQGRLTPASVLVLERFAQAREMPAPRRILMLKRSGVYRQTVPGNLGLYVAAIFGKI